MQIVNERDINVQVLIDVLLQHQKKSWLAARQTEEMKENNEEEKKDILL
jgi:hypothetical protein